MWKFELIPAHPSDYPALEMLWRFYLYDLSLFCGRLKGWKSPIEMNFDSEQLKGYLFAKDSHLFIIKIRDESAGFILFQKFDDTLDVDWYLSDFFIISTYQQVGVSLEIALYTFKKFPGEWAMGVAPENIRAVKFWRKAIDLYTKGQFSEQLKTSKDFKTKDNASLNPMIIFKFCSEAGHE